MASAEGGHGHLSTAASYLSGADFTELQLLYPAAGVADAAPKTTPDVHGNVLLQLLLAGTTSLASPSRLGRRRVSSSAFSIAIFCR